MEHKLALSGWATFKQVWQGDIQNIFKQVLQKHLGWRDCNVRFFTKAKERVALTIFFEKFINDPRFTRLPADLQKRISNPQDLVVSSFLQYFLILC